MGLVDVGTGKSLLSCGISTFLHLFPFLREMGCSSYSLYWHHPFPPDSSSVDHMHLCPGHRSYWPAYPRALPDGNSNKSVTRRLEKLVDDTKAGISVHHLQFPFTIRGVLLAWIISMPQSWRSNWDGGNFLFKIVEFHSATHSSSWTNQSSTLDHQQWSRALLPVQK